MLPPRSVERTYGGWQASREPKTIPVMVIGHQLDTSNNLGWRSMRSITILASSESGLKARMLACSVVSRPAMPFSVTSQPRSSDTDEPQIYQRGCR